MEVEKTVIFKLSYLASDLGFVANTINVLFQCTVPKKCTVFWASLVAQLAKNLLARQETSVQFLGWEDSLEKG